MSKSAWVASGHPATSEAALGVLEDGGNAFDAAIAAAAAACVAEPLLASLGGGGFLLSRSTSGEVQVHDFFAQTPGHKRHDAQYRPILADFGTTSQTFHIGMNTVAVPGVPAGLAVIHQQLCTRPMSTLIEPAIHLARSGVQVNREQADVMAILTPILEFSPVLSEQFSQADGQRIRVGDVQDMSAIAASLERLALEGDAPFYHGDIAAEIDRLSREQAGHLSLKDLDRYRCVRRPALSYQAGSTRLWSNPLPSSGGILIAQTVLTCLALIKAGHEPMDALASAMNRTERLRTAQIDPRSLSDLDDSVIEGLIALRQCDQVSRGTTQISIADGAGNLASMTLSNGEGSGCMVANGGMHLNNFLGEDDLMPAAIGSWQTDVRLSSMMAPTLMQVEDQHWVIGSAGSNRIRSAIAQVILNILVHGMSLAEAVHAPRMHLEGRQIDLEPGLDLCHKSLLDGFGVTRWTSPSLYFGGVNAVMTRSGSIGQACADPRRGGQASVLPRVG